MDIHSLKGVVCGQNEGLFQKWFPSSIILSTRLAEDPTWTQLTIHWKGNFFICLFTSQDDRRMFWLIDPNFPLYRNFLESLSLQHGQWRLPCRKFRCHNGHIDNGAQLCFDSFGLSHIYIDEIDFEIFILLEILYAISTFLNFSEVWRGGFRTFKKNVH